MSIDAIIATRAPWTPHVLRDVIAVSRDIAAVAFIAEDHAAALVEAHPATIEYLMWAAGFAAKHNAVGLGRVVASVLAVLTGARPPRSQEERSRVLSVELGMLEALPIRREAIPRDTIGQAYAIAGMRPPWVEPLDTSVPPPPPPPPKEPEPAPLLSSIEVSYAAFEDVKKLQQLGRPTTDVALRAIATFHGVPPQILGVDLDAPGGAR